MTGLVAKKALQMIPAAKQVKNVRYILRQKKISIPDCMVKEYSYKMIAAVLNSSHDTIRFHMKNIYDKLRVCSATQAVSKAIKDKLVKSYCILILHGASHIKMWDGRSIS